MITKATNANQSRVMPMSCNCAIICAPASKSPHLAGHVVINARAAKGRVDEKSSAKRPQDAADAVHAERVQGVVILQPGLELRDSEEANDARDAPSDKRADRTHIASRRRDRHQARHDARADSQHTGFSLDDPFRQRPGAARGSGAERVRATSIDFFADPLPDADVLTMGMILHD